MPEVIRLPESHSSMSLFGIFVFAALIVAFSVHRLAEALNLRSASVQAPKGFKNLYDPQRYARSQDYLKARTRFAWLSSTIFLAATLAFWLSGGFGFLDDRVRSPEYGPILSGLIYIGVLWLGLSILGLPFRVYSVFVIEERFGFNRTNLTTFFLDGLKTLVLSVLLGAPLLAGILALFEYAGPWAWFYGWALVVLFMVGIQFIAPRFILPLFNTYTPLEAGDLRAAILRYADSIGFPLENIFVMDGSRRSIKSNAFFTGFGKHRRIALFDTLIRAHTIAELVAILAHEIGHYRKKHILKNLAISVVLSGALLYAFSFSLRSPFLFEAFFVEQTSVYAGLVLFSLLLQPVELLLSLLLNRVARGHEREADRFAVETTHDKTALISALKKLSADNLSNLSPHPFYVALSYSHPPIQQRIRSIEEIPIAHQDIRDAPSDQRCMDRCSRVGDRVRSHHL
jgi:STE24 endopeptidase